MSQHICKRCGHKWNGRLKPLGLGRYGQVKLCEALPVRCARCRSKFWDKDYVRKISQDRMNAGSYAYIPPLPLNLTSPGLGPNVRSKNPADLNEKDFKKLLDEVNPVVRSTVRRKSFYSGPLYPSKSISPVVKRAATVGKKQAPNGHRRRAGDSPSKLKHGIHKGKK